jgi:SAM-dependent methyltransferase
MSLTAGNFFDEWSIYDEILAHNYMYHDEIYVHIQRFFAQRFGDRPFSILDLGCGSARHLATSLAGRAISRYVGYDLSRVALDHARQNLAGIKGQLSLHCGDLLAGLRGSSDTFDVIFTSFALHHLPAQDKALFFQLALQHLAADGVLLVIDTFRENDESRELYLDRYCGWLRSRCQTLPVPALNAICDHIRSCDHPETPLAFRSMTRAAGFDAGLELARYAAHHVWCYRAAGVGLDRANGTEV